jgi:lipoate-protein ligase A
VDARLDQHMEITVGDRKICGHGAGQIEDAVVICGNLIQGFDHERATGVLRLPDEGMRAEVLRLMRRYVSATPADPDTFQRSAVDAYATALGLRPVPGDLTEVEQAALTELDARFTSEEWIAGPARRPRRRAREVKVRAGIWVFAAEHEDARVMASVVDDSVERARLRTAAPDRELRAAESALAGVALAKAPDVLADFGDLGRQFAAAFAGADGKSL